MVKKGKYMNQFISQLIDRRSIRNFNPDMVPDEDINDILEAGLYAATGMNNQKLRLIAITDKNVRNEISQMNAKIMGKDLLKKWGLEGDFEGIGHLAVGYAANPEDMKAERLERKAGRIVRI